MFSIIRRFLSTADSLPLTDSDSFFPPFSKNCLSVSSGAVSFFRFTVFFLLNAPAHAPSGGLSPAPGALPDVLLPATAFF